MFLLAFVLHATFLVLSLVAPTQLLTYDPAFYLRSLTNGPGITGDLVGFVRVSEPEFELAAVAARRGPGASRR